MYEIYLRALVYPICFWIFCSFFIFLKTSNPRLSIFLFLPSVMNMLIFHLFFWVQLYVIQSVPYTEKLLENNASFYLYVEHAVEYLSGSDDLGLDEYDKFIFNVAHLFDKFNACSYIILSVFLFPYYKINFKERINSILGFKKICITVLLAVVGFYLIYSSKNNYVDHIYSRQTSIIFFPGKCAVFYFWFQVIWTELEKGKLTSVWSSIPMFLFVNFVYANSIYYSAYFTDTDLNGMSSYPFLLGYWLKVFIGISVVAFIRKLWQTAFVPFLVYLIILL